MNSLDPLFMFSNSHWTLWSAYDVVFISVELYQQGPGIACHSWFYALIFPQSKQLIDMWSFGGVSSECPAALGTILCFTHKVIISCGKHILSLLSENATFRGQIRYYNVGYSPLFFCLAVSVCIGLLWQEPLLIWEINLEVKRVRRSHKFTGETIGLVGVTNKDLLANDILCMAGIKAFDKYMQDLIAADMNSSCGPPLQLKEGGLLEEGKEEGGRRQSSSL